MKAKTLVLVSLALALAGCRAAPPEVPPTPTPTAMPTPILAPTPGQVSLLDSVERAILSALKREGRPYQPPADILERIEHALRRALLR